MQMYKGFVLNKYSRTTSIIVNDMINYHYDIFLYLQICYFNELIVLYCPYFTN